MKAGNGMESNMVRPRCWSGPGKLKSLGKSCLGSFQQSVPLVIKFLTKTKGKYLGLFIHVLGKHYKLGSGEPSFSLYKSI